MGGEGGSVCGEKAEGNVINSFLYSNRAIVLIEAHHTILQLRAGCCIQGVVTYMSRVEAFATGIKFNQAIKALFGVRRAAKVSGSASYMQTLQFDL